MKKHRFIPGIIIILVVIGVLVGTYMANKDNEQALSSQDIQQVDTKENRQIKEKMWL